MSYRIGANPNVQRKSMPNFCLHDFGFLHHAVGARMRPTIKVVLIWLGVLLLSLHSIVDCF